MNFMSKMERLRIMKSAVVPTAKKIKNFSLLSCRHMLHLICKRKEVEHMNQLMDLSLTVSSLYWVYRGVKHKSAAVVTIGSICTLFGLIALSV